MPVEAESMSVSPAHKGLLAVAAGTGFGITITVNGSEEMRQEEIAILLPSATFSLY